jgi:hypothetical protein
VIADPVLERAAEALFVEVGKIDAFGDFESVTELFAEAELEAILGAVRDSIAAPVLALHQPCHPAGTPTPSDCWCVSCGRAQRYPCPTVRALGVTG